MKKLFAFIIVVFLALPFFAVEPRKKDFKPIEHETSKTKLVKLFKIYGWRIDKGKNDIRVWSDGYVTLYYHDLKIHDIWFTFDDSGNIESQYLSFTYPPELDVYKKAMFIAAQECMQLLPPKSIVGQIRIPAKNNNIYALFCVYTFPETEHDDEYKELNILLSYYDVSKDKYSFN